MYLNLNTYKNIYSINSMNKKCVRAINTNDNVVSYFKGVCSAGQHLDMFVGEIILVCDGKSKSAISRTKQKCL